VSAPLIDGRGCLTEAGIAALRTATPGRAAPELSAHLASCSRCQQRVLAVDAPGPRKKRASTAPSLGRTVALMALVVGVILAALATMRYLVGR
jgi:hypothetical protein